MCVYAGVHVVYLHVCAFCDICVRAYTSGKYMHVCAETTETDAYVYTHTCSRI
jgi:hypothetical protein